MSRNNLILILLLTVLGIVGYWAYDTYSNKVDKSIDICDLSEEEIVGQFAVKDTAGVNRIVITNTFGERIRLERKGNQWIYQPSKYDSETGEWKSGSVNRARTDAANLLLKTFYRIELRNYVGKNAKPNIIKRLTGNHKQVDIYIDDELVKTWYVGTPSQDNYGTYMMLEIPDCGTSRDPFEMKMSAFHGSLNSRFFTEDAEWRYTGLWEVNPLDLKKVVIWPFENPDESFHVELEGKNTFHLFNHNGQEMSRFDTSAVRDLFLQFKKLHFEKFAELDLLKRDSLINQAVPYYLIQTVDKTGVEKQLTIYKIKLPPGSLDMAGNPIEYDLDRLFGVTKDQDVLLIQYFTFGGLFRTIRDFRATP